MFAVKAKIYGVLHKFSSIAFDEISRYWSALKSSWFLGFSLVSDLITESDQSVRAVHSCNTCSWFQLLSASIVKGAGKQAQPKLLLDFRVGLISHGSPSDIKSC